MYRRSALKECRVRLVVISDDTRCSQPESNVRRLSVAPLRRVLVEPAREVEVFGGIQRSFDLLSGVPSECAAHDPAPGEPREWQVEV